MKYLFIDTETSGLPQQVNFHTYYHPKHIKYYDNSRLIEIGYIIYDDDNKIKDNDILIKPDNFIVENTFIHGLSNEMLNNEGNDINEALNILEYDIIDVDVIIAHNIKFDINIILSECYRYKKSNLIELIKNKKHICTMNMGKNYLNQKLYPKLTILYKKLYNKDVKQIHRALSDAIICKDCYFKMIKN